MRGSILCSTNNVNITAVSAVIDCFNINRFFPTHTLLKECYCHLLELLFVYNFEVCLFLQTTLQIYPCDDSLHLPDVHFSVCFFHLVRVYNFFRSYMVYFSCFQSISWLIIQPCIGNRPVLMSFHIAVLLNSRRVKHKLYHQHNDNTGLSSIKSSCI